MRLALALALAAAPAAAAPVTYQVTDRTTVDVRIYKAGVASGLAHDHVLRAGQLTGTLVYDPAEKRLVSVRFTVDARSLQVDPGRVRHQYGLPDDVDDDDRAQIAQNMRGPDQLAVDRYPTMTFESTGATAAPDGRIELAGRLTIRGQTRDVRLPVAIWATEERLQGKGELRIRHADFGIKPYEAALGAIRNQERIDLIFAVRAAAEAPPAAPASAPPE
ncbi:MAG: YceI family protein [Myxococcales bacterium]|nr:YceI family protein [Myxococcales bacterium]